MVVNFDWPNSSSYTVRPVSGSKSYAFLTDVLAQANKIQNFATYEKPVGQTNCRNYANFVDNGLFSPMERPCSTPSRSGSATPIIDEEARARVIGMEKQLADLSTLVHMALMPSKGLGDNLHKDLENLRREILGPPSSSSSFGTGRDDASDSSSLSRCSDLESDRGVNNGSYALLRENFNSDSNNRYFNGKARSSGTYSNPEVMQSHLKILKRRTHDIQTEVKSLKRVVQNNSQTTREVLKDAFDRIKQHLRMFADHAKYQNQKDRSSTAIFGVLKADQEKHAAAIQQLERELSQFEKKVDETRDNVVSGNKRLKIDEVEEFTETLTNIIRSAANKFANLHEKLKEAMNEEMEKFVREEKIFKEEPSKLDNALRRCKKLTGTIITMKKLAMVQDPKGSKNRNAIPSPINSPSKESFDVPNGQAALSKIQNGQKNGSFTVRPAPGKMLDGLLEELNNLGSDMVSNSDTIKRSPKSPQADDQMLNCLAKKSAGDFSDSSTCSSIKSNGTLTGVQKSNYYDQNSAYKSPRSQSPKNLSNGFSLAPPPPPPPPPIRSSSSINHNIINRPIIYDFGAKNFSTAPKTAMIHTNAVDSGGEDFRSPADFRSTAKVAASSSESINSQERSTKPPPPPPPPRNRQEMMEYRQHELICKQLKFRNNNNGLRA
uniref:Uncharacterized protein n=1 Tax=Romanomermis culicivorax TaxID=13658 RepID=A0A915IZV8_ROMCU